MLYVITDYRLFYSMLFDNSFISHRTEFNNSNYLFTKSIITSVHNFFLWQYHASSLQFPFIFISILTTIYILIKNNFVEYKNKDYRLLKKILIIILWISIFYWFWKNIYIHNMIENIPFINTINISRIHWFHPLLWFLAFSISLFIIKKSNLNKKNIIIYSLLFWQIILGFSMNENYNKNIRKGNFTFNQFYSEDLFNEVKVYIWKDTNKFRVVWVGIHPAILQYNNFYTLDWYFYNYPIEYKHDFYKIIWNELKKDKKINDYYNNWWSRAYIFSTELWKNYIWLKNDKKIINNLNINSTQLKIMWWEYIISAVQINNFKELNLNLENIFENSSSKYIIYLYKIL